MTKRLSPQLGTALLTLLIAGCINAGLSWTWALPTVNRDPLTLARMAPRRNRQRGLTYFPLAIGNRWVYKRTVPEGEQPLCEYDFTLTDHSTTGTAKPRHMKYVGIGGASSGTETYTVQAKEGDEFVIQPTGNPAPGFGFEPCLLGSLAKLTWSVHNPSGVLAVAVENRQGSLGPNESVHIDTTIGDFSTNTQLHAFLGIDIIPTDYRDAITVPAGAFSGCIRNTIIYKGDEHSKRFIIRRFFAPNVGLVSETETNAAGNTLYKLELLSYVVK